MSDESNEVTSNGFPTLYQDSTMNIHMGVAYNWLATHPSIKNIHIMSYFTGIETCALNNEHDMQMILILPSLRVNPPECDAKN